MDNPNDLKKRVLEAKEQLPKSGVTSLLIFKYPHLEAKKMHLSNVLSLRVVDEDITEKLESLVETLKRQSCE